VRNGNFVPDATNPPRPVSTPPHRFARAHGFRLPLGERVNWTGAKASEPAPAREIEDVFGRGGAAYRRHLAIGALLAVLVLVVVPGGLAWGQYKDSQHTSLANQRARAVLARSVIDTYFRGELANLRSIAGSPSVVDQDIPAMQRYLSRLQAAGDPAFSAGIGWIDRTGSARVSTVRRSAARRADFADRMYFKRVMATGAPFVSQSITSRLTAKHVVIMAMPTRDARGRITGMLAGALMLQPSGITRKALDLGGAGLSILDRGGFSILSGSSRPRNATLARSIHGTGTLPDARGLDGAKDQAISYSTSEIAGWTVVIDQPRAQLFADARRGFFLQLALVAAAASIVLFLIAFILLRGRHEAERERNRARQRRDLARALGSASRGSEVSNGLVAGLHDSFPGALCIVALEDEHHHHLELSASADGSFPSSEDARAIVVAQAATLAYDAGAAIIIGKDTSLRAALPGVHQALLGAAHSFYAAPLVTRGGSRLGALCVLFAHAQPLDETEQAQVTWYAEQAAQALDRTTAFEHEHAVAVRLQRSLLSDRLPEIEGVELIGRYNAGGAGLVIGGDWYDAVRRSDGLVHVTVGDVAGHGVTAAVLMGQLRSAFRTLAYEHTSPAQVLRRMLRHVDEDEMATALCLTLDPYTQDLTYASAGHPPSLLVDGSAAGVSRLGHALAPPLGYVQPSAIREAVVELPAGGTLVAYTDGLVERRGWSIDTGIDLLASVVGASASLGAAPLADRIFEEVTPHIGSHDDIALLIVRLLEVPQRMDIEVPSDPSALADLRRRLRRWLELRGLDVDERDDAILAVSEACNNAIEHAYSEEEPGAIHLLIEHRDDALSIRISDRGTWQPKSPSFERGRGIPLMRAVMDMTTIEHDARGTSVTLSRLLA
jgi:serine phosphatase RsbU (regulator of sigma subunit)/anti-sigma regulatory factor (Ser/Thr protein kinase)